MDTVRSAVEQAPNLYLVGIDAFARPTRFKQLRSALPPGSTLLMGKKTLMRVALGDSEGERAETEHFTIRVANRGRPRFDSYEL